MKREDVTKIFEGATDEQIDSILNINSADIGKAKGDYDTLKADLKTASDTVSNLTGELSALKESKASAEDWEKKFTELQDKDVVELLTSISQQANIPFDISADLEGVTISGYIPVCTCREAMQHIAFACGAVVDTSGSESVKLFLLNGNVTQNVPLEKIRQGQSFETSDKVTEVQLMQHKFVPNNEETELYKASESGTGENILVQFSEPHHSFSHIWGGEIVESGASYAIISTSDPEFVLKGKGYTDYAVVKSIKNPNVLASDIPNIVSISDETLISSGNVDSVLQRCYDHYTKNSGVNLKIEQTRGCAVNIGDTITAETEYLGTLTGRIISARYNLNGGIIVKECEML